MSSYVYHRGYLPIDRETVPGLTDRAEWYLTLGTPKGVPIYAGDPESPLGEGRGVVTQQRVREHVYDYIYTPFIASN